ncbi:MAG: right-handed parallel beta-helix repeat-containing protein [Verrucomicrobiota bacterium]
MMRVLLSVCVLLFGSGFGEPCWGEEIWIDQERGDDAAAGSREHPLATFSAGIANLKPGMTLHVEPGKKPWPGEIRITASGTAEAPVIVDGHGSLVSGRRPLTEAEWNQETDGTYSRKLPNNAWGMESHWEGGFPLVWFDGEAAKNVSNRDDLKPGSYFLSKNRKLGKEDPLHNTLFIQLPEGKAFADVQVEAIAMEGGIFVGGNHVIVRNFITEYGGRDGYSTHRNQGVVFENVEARFFMDQGMSHHGAEAIVRNSHFHHNAGGGIVDVYPEAKVRYENCLIEADTWRGGVEFHKGEFEMHDCVIRANSKAAISVAKGAKVRLVGCQFIGTEDGDSRGLSLAADSRLKIENCSFSGFTSGLSAILTKGTKLDLENARFSKSSYLQVTVKRFAEDASSPFQPMVSFENLQFPDGAFIIRSMTQDPANQGWKVREQHFSSNEMAEFVAALENS